MQAHRQAVIAGFFTDWWSLFQTGHRVSCPDEDLARATLRSIDLSKTQNTLSIIRERSYFLSSRRHLIGL